MEQGQGDSSSSLPSNSILNLSVSQLEERLATGIEQRVPQYKDFTAEWPGPLDGRLGYSES
ncbi:MAG TPA: hypothetical protein VKZ48_06260 [Burkholderiales bacterium]|nr:hypothetical protein [Burkholderiales bacterium]